MHAERDERGTAEAELTRVQGELEAALARVAELEHELSSGGLQARIAELERAADDDLERRAREQAAAAAAVAPAADREAIADQFDAAAAALRARVDAPTRSRARGRARRRSAGRARAVSASPTPVRARRRRRARRAEPSRPTARRAGLCRGGPVPAEPVAADPEPVADAPPPVAAPRPRPHIVTESRHPPRADVVGTLAARVPVAARRARQARPRRPARRDPAPARPRPRPARAARRAARVRPHDPRRRDLRGQRRRRGRVRPHGRRSRARAREAAFHVTADVVTLAELLAGVPRRMGRWFGPVRVKGRKRGAEVVRDTLAGARARPRRGRPRGRRPRPRPRLPQLRLRDPTRLDEGPPLRRRPGDRGPVAAALASGRPRRRARSGSRSDSTASPTPSSRCRARRSAACSEATPAPRGERPASAAIAPRWTSCTAGPSAPSTPATDPPRPFPQRAGEPVAGPRRRPARHLAFPIREHAVLRPPARPLGVLAARRCVQDRQARRPRGGVRPAGARAHRPRRDERLGRAVQGVREARRQADPGPRGVLRRRPHDPRGPDRAQPPDAARRDRRGLPEPHQAVERRLPRRACTAASPASTWSC